MENTFKKKRIIYTETKQLLIEVSSNEKITLNTKLAKDLSLLGDDNYDFLIMFIDKYSLEYNDFIYNDYFLQEHEVFNPNKLVLRISLSLFLSPLLLVEHLFLLFYPKLKTPLLSFFTKKFKERHTKDLTLKDLINWRIKGKFIP